LKERSVKRWLKRLAVSLLLLVVVGVIKYAIYHHQVTPALQEKLDELDRTDPGWRLREIEAARLPVSETENGAIRVAAAARNLPPDLFDREFGKALVNLSPENGLSDDQAAKLRDELDQLRPALLKVRELAQFPRGRFPITYAHNPLDTSLTHLQSQVRPTVRLLALDVFDRAHQGDLIEAVRSCRAALNASRSIGDEPTAISQLVRVACVAETCKGIERTLGQGEPPATELETLQKALEEEEAFPTLMIVARGERAVNHALLEVIESGDVYLEEIGGGKPSWFDRLIGFYARDKIRENHPEALDYVSQVQEIARLPQHERTVLMDKWTARVRAEKKKPALLFLPALQLLEGAIHRNQAKLRCLCAALAAELYRQSKGDWPDSLDRLTPNLLAAVPLDPYDGAPLRCHRLADGIVIYSVGADREDNGGTFDPEQPTRPGADIGVRLWDVKHRRQPPRPPEKIPEQPDVPD
jgi:hypothetical protein